ncbi:alpha/beta fold hydrolase [Aquibaculum sediminis]|uniref:alpha/beta fold hydrolase n=1 Tax=Aquibaculum sediminis TaxID=3231907 RepID=UPI0034516D9D
MSRAGVQVEVAGKRVFAGTGGVAFDAAQPVVVFLHGAGMDHSVWALQSRYLAHHGRAVLALDLPGHGRSEGPPLDSIAEIADWLAELLHAAGVERASLVGHSMGAVAAVSFAARHPKMAQSLALLGCAASMPVHPDLLAAAEANDHAAIDMVNGWAHGAGAHIGGHPLPGTWLTGQGNRLLERAAPGVLYTDLAACNAWSDGAAEAAAVDCPVLLLMGSEDKMTPPKAGRKLATALSDCRAEEFAGCGHMIMTERPEQTLAVLKGFLQ